MNKLKIGGGILVGGLLIGLLVFAMTHKYEDSHLRRDGVRVKLEEYSLLVDTCDEGKSDRASCVKTMKVGDEDVVFSFQYQDFKKSGFPQKFVAEVNGHEFYRRDDIDIEKNMGGDYQVFLNFKVIDKYVVFTLTDGTNGLNTTLYAIDKDGNIVLQDKKYDNDFLIKDYEEFIKYGDDNAIDILTTKLVQDMYYNDENICNIPRNTVVEAHYTYTYKDGKFSRKLTEEIKAEKYIKDNELNCGDKN